MKVTVLKKGNNRDYTLVYAVILLIIGIFLTFNSEHFLTIIFDILGSLAILFGIYRFINYYHLKNELNVEDSNILMNAIASTLGGFIVILLSSVLTDAIKIVTGVWLIFLGINKLSNASIWKNIDQKLFLTELISSIILILLGIYCIVAENVVLMVLGIILIIYAIVEMINYFSKKKLTH